MRGVTEGSLDRRSVASAASRVPAAWNVKQRTRKELNVNGIIKKLGASLAAMSLVATLGLASVSADEMVPHKAKAAGSFIFAGESELELTGSGNAAHLGEITSNGTIAILGPASCEGGFAIHDDQTLTSVDTGEQLIISVDGEACPTATPGVYRILAPFTITGGTGRFVGASGEGTALCFGDFINQTFSFTQQGTVSRPR